MTTTPTPRKAVATAIATIAAGEAISSAVDISAGALALMLSPDGWDSANITLQSSGDGQNFCDLLGSDGRELVWAMGANRAVLVPPEMTQGVSYLKIRSGHRDAPVTQYSARTFTLVLT
jgi:hypothetical protein